MAGSAQATHTAGKKMDPAAPVPARRRSLGRSLSRFGVPIVTAALFGLFCFLNPTTFPTIPNFQVVAASNSVALLLALGGLVPLIAGEFDLSIGFTLELSAVVTAVLLGQDQYGVFATLAVVIAMGAAIGLVNGLLITGIGISSFIATLGIGSLSAAASLYLTQGTILIEGIPRGMINFGQGSSWGVPNVVGLGLAGLFVFWIVFEHTTFGRKLLAVGLSRRASDLVGIRTSVMLTVAFVISGAIAALCGFLVVSRIAAASSGVGTNYLLPAIAACFLGATTYRVGRFNVIGTGFAVLLVAIGLNGLQLMGGPDWVEPAFNGGILLIAVGASRLAAKRR